MAAKGKSDFSLERKAHEEGLKLLYDTMKHLTTLSTGSILLLVALLEKLFTNPQWKILIVLSFGCFFLSVLGAVMSMLYVADSIKDEVISEKTVNYAQNSYSISLISFLVGIVCLVSFTIRNFF